MISGRLGSEGLVWYYSSKDSCLLQHRCKNTHNRTDKTLKQICFQHVLRDLDAFFKSGFYVTL